MESPATELMLRKRRQSLLYENTRFAVRLFRCKRVSWHAAVPISALKNHWSCSWTINVVLIGVRQFGKIHSGAIFQICFCFFIIFSIASQYWIDICCERPSDARTLNILVSTRKYQNACYWYLFLVQHGWKVWRHISKEEMYRRYLNHFIVLWMLNIRLHFIITVKRSYHKK